MSRRLYMVSYDISDPRRLRQVAKTIEGFGYRIQFSVFTCPLDLLRLEKLKAALHPIIDHDEDQVLIVDLGPENANPASNIQSLGRPIEKQLSIIII